METNSKIDNQRQGLANRLRAGEKSAAAELVDSYYKQIYLFMRRLGNSTELSEDLTQETFLQAWQHIGQLKNDNSLNSWIYRIATNVSKHHWRKNKKNYISFENIQGFKISDDGKQVNEQLGQLEEVVQLRENIGKLSLKLQQVVILHYMQHLSIADAADALGIRQGTFKSRLNRALNKLRKSFS